MMKRKHRMALARQDKDTTMMWDLIAAAVEQANILFQKLQGKDAKKMRGRSKISFEKQVKNMLQGIEDDSDEAEFVTKANWLRRLAQEHAAQGNRLINVARRMKAGAKDGTPDPEKQTNHTYNAATLEAYIQKGDNYSQKEHLTEQQTKQIKAGWSQAIAKMDHKKSDRHVRK